MTPFEVLYIKKRVKTGPQIKQMRMFTYAASTQYILQAFNAYDKLEAS